MNYVQLHLGDWISGTLDLTPTERGVYMDLLVRYYKEEKPLMQVDCKRIARGYASGEQEAMQFVLQRFFRLENGAYHHARCDAEIAKFQALSDKRKAASKKRWSNIKDEEVKGAYPSAMQEQSKCNANAYANDMLTINHKPLTNNHIDVYTHPAPQDAPTPTKKVSKILKPEGILQDDWEAFLKLRKQKRLPLTQKALDLMLREADKAGLSPQEMINACLEHSWAGFKADWDRGQNSREAIEAAFLRECAEEERQKELMRATAS